MKRTYIRLLLAAILSISFCVYAPAQSLTPQEKEALKTRVKNKVDEFQFYLGQIANKRSTSSQVKTNAYNLAVKLFIGECGEYEIYDPEDECEVLKPPVAMETASFRYSKPLRTPMKDYLTNLKNNKRYDQIEITDADVVRVDNIKRVGDHYECTAHFCQKYVGYRDRRIVYTDYTTKAVRVYIQAIEIPRADGTTETIWNALLGDIYVTSISKNH